MDYPLRHTSPHLATVKPINFNKESTIEEITLKLNKLLEKMILGN